MTVISVSHPSAELHSCWFAIKVGRGWCSGESSHCVAVELCITLCDDCICTWTGCPATRWHAHRHQLYTVRGGRSARCHRLRVWNGILVWDGVLLTTHPTCFAAAAHKESMTPAPQPRGQPPYQQPPHQPAYHCPHHKPHVDDGTAVRRSKWWRRGWWAGCCSLDDLW
jgi:hypothetical protein